MDRGIVHDTHMAINMAHRLVYFVPEAAEEYAALGVTGRGGYFASRVAPLGAVANEVIVATFYNFAPRAVSAAMPGVWSATTPPALQDARFRAVDRALKRIGFTMSSAEIDEARSIIDPVVAGLDYAGKPLAAANAAIALPTDPLLALWQQVTIIREWRGDAHIALLVANGVGPCECMVLQVGTGRFPLAVTMATREWNQAEWAGAIRVLSARGWVDASGAMTPEGTAAREAIEDDTNRLCEPIWNVVGEAKTARLAEIIWPMHKAVEAAGTYGALS
jgi:hypothetical protein